MTGQFAVARCFAVLEAGRAGQDSAVPVGDPQVDRQFEAPAFTREPFADLPDGLVQGRAPLVGNLAVLRGENAAVDPPRQPIHEVRRFGTQIHGYDPGGGRDYVKHSPRRGAEGEGGDGSGGQDHAASLT